MDSREILMNNEFLSIRCFFEKRVSNIWNVITETSKISLENLKNFFSSFMKSLETYFGIDNFPGIEKDPSNPKQK